jgi:hypothetical protein
MFRNQAIHVALAAVLLPAAFSDASASASAMPQRIGVTGAFAGQPQESVRIHFNGRGARAATSGLRLPRAETKGVGTLASLPVVARSAAGFHWGDAGIGAAGMLALAIVALGVALALGSRRHRSLPRTAPEVTRS